MTNPQSSVNMPAGPTLLTRIETAQLLRVSARKVDQLAASGELSKIKIGTAVRFDMEDVRRLITRLTCGVQDRSDHARQYDQTNLHDDGRRSG